MHYFLLTIHPRQSPLLWGQPTTKPGVHGEGGGRGWVGAKQSVNLELCLPPDPWPPTEPQATNEKQTHKAPIFQFTGWGLTREDRQQYSNVYTLYNYIHI